MKVDLRVISDTSLDLSNPGNVQGDELIARALRKYMDRLGVECGLNGRRECGTPLGKPDFSISFSNFLEPVPGTHNILYAQNAFPPEAWPGGTVGQFNLVCDFYDSYIFTSAELRDACGKPGCVLPFAADPELYYAYRQEDAKLFPHLVHGVVFVGNNIRGPEVNARYIEPVADRLTIYGNPWGGPLADRCKGKISFHDEAKTYSLSKICLNAHIAEHIRYNTLNVRVFNIMMCEGFIISDDIPALAEFSEAVVTTTGYDDLRDKVQYYLDRPEERRRMAEKGPELIRRLGHSYADRAKTLVGFLITILAGSTNAEGMGPTVG